MSRPDAFAFVAGGTVQAGGGIYLERHADTELLEHCRAGDFTYVLTSRQMGKSSLMIRAAERLAAEGTLPVIIDLTEFGAQTTAEQWYKGFLLAVQDQLGLETPAAQWWDGQAHHTFAHRFTRYLREVALTQRPERLVVFVDEIDTTLGVDFTDDFFAAIRFLYQNRAADPELHRLSFVLIGVATPGDLIKDTARTPFNIGHRIELTDFTLDEARVLARHLGVPGTAGDELIAWILRWTGGHPYLTLRALRSLAEYPPPAWTVAEIDERIRGLFLRTGAESDSNLQFVRDMLTRKAFDREAVLRTYAAIRQGEPVQDKELDQVISWLKLSGVVASRGGRLHVRNAIYDHVFDERWARDHLRLNVNWRKRLTRVAAGLLVLIVLVTIPLAIYAWHLKTEAEFQARQAGIQRDDAHRQRAIAEQTLETAKKAAEALKPYDQASAAAIEKQIVTTREDAHRDAPDATTKLRAERDAAYREIERLKRAMREGRGAAAETARVPPRPVLTPEQLAVQRVIDQYERAYSARDLKALQQVWSLSSSDAAALRAQFADSIDLRVTVDSEDIRISPDGRRASVTAARRFRLIPRSGKGGEDSTALVEFTMERRGGNWTIRRVVSSSGGA